MAEDDRRFDRRVLKGTPLDGADYDKRWRKR